MPASGNTSVYATRHSQAGADTVSVTGKALLRRLPASCRRVRQEGSHVRIECDGCATTVPIHAGEDLPGGTLRAIERDLEPCLGRKWLRRRA